jgi:prophage DNA circulation protein
MSHFNRLIQSAYTGPESGERIAFTYRQAIPRDFSHRLDDYEYVGIDGVEHRDLGIGDDSYSIQAIFNDTNHDVSALAFIDLLRERALPGFPGFFEHPREGVIEVVVSKVSVTHDPRSDASETTIDIEFQKQLTLPKQQKESVEITTVKQLEAFNASAANDFDLQTTLATVRDKLAAVQEAVSNVNKITEVMGDIYSTNAAVLSTAEQIQTDIKNNISTLINTPKTLASQTQQLIQLSFGTDTEPANRSQSFLQLYYDTIGININPDLYNAEPSKANRNRIASQELTAATSIASNMANVVLQLDKFTTRQEAFDALANAKANIYNLGLDLDKLQSQYDSLNVQDQYFSSSETYKDMTSLARIATAAVQDETSGLKTTILVTTATDDNILNICAKYYKNVDDETLDFFTDSNGFNIDQTLIVPAGTQLVI